eukprot:PLAT11228.2.p2 GENE.PLAT11228.2~~PLAT11228.2.p2  ORF type:complete len:251 (+),score=116.18 PLAT11228.2:26-754(+)
MRIESMLFAVAATALALAVPAAAGNHFNPERLRFVDKVGQNLLFRGNLPLNENLKFAWLDVVDTMQQRAAAANVTMPSDFHLVDFSLLTPLSPINQQHIQAEHAWFDDHSELGEWISAPVYGDAVSPFLINSNLRAAMMDHYPHWQIDDFPSKLDHVRSLVETQGDRPVIVYFHCEAGVDRTGEMYGAYMMKYHGQTLAQVLDYDSKVEPRPINPFSHHGLQWYCLYLKQQHPELNPNCAQD